MSDKILNNGQKQATVLNSAVKVIKTAILQSQARAVKVVNQEQLALYFGIGRYISDNTRNKNWGTGAIANISSRLRQELPGLRGFSETNLKNMRLFYEAWNCIETDSSVETDKLENLNQDAVASNAESTVDEPIAIRQLQLTNFPDFPLN